MAIRPTVPCGLCGQQTPMIATKRCDRCWELEKRVQADPEIALAIIALMIHEGRTP